ncbi:probable tRNA N6-adenosine threonylcarbamoyltransferase, mitochondrial [Anopheles maculipalpis]|uniref:probable tRNA N6-adenosine threonylcarbamoyltransferase, mitochondrial n=1 Tax=Anopheles maculipalpis TaxID=1496333 RepID=UPI0021598FDB|nr:probable tRNA N6-adenosine threonylcarbamoyltransferase, mitochondrial [Anopheles maculipalpis]
MCRIFTQITRLSAIARSHFSAQYSSRYAPLVLGIETSCDDTGAAVVSSNGTVLGEYTHSQQTSHLRFGGIIPPVAQDIHRANIENVVQKTFDLANISPQDIDAVAVTNRPGLPLSLIVGMRFAKYIARTYDKPLIPIHHMQAHALMARMTSPIPYPFLCLLVSGGHSLLVFVESTSSFRLLGETLDDAPGEALDKIARRLKLRNIAKYAQMSGGQAIEVAAQTASNNTSAYEFPLPLSKYRDCQFSFAGLKNTATRHILERESTLNLAPDALLPDYEDFCACFLKGVTRHMLHRTQRAIEYCERRNLFGSADKQRSLVISGGVACNDIIFNALRRMAEQFGYSAYRPPKKLCTDNGTMIAWNGVEKLLAADTTEMTKNYETIDISGKCSIGESLIDDVKEANLACKWVKVDIFPGKEQPSCSLKL